ncbi:GspE/PulE family protein [Komagataeibacter diospyri]|uniref:GspE/PulE family protein n=1 Tax=Komagataeibacter diospyri TaxID=1932662 RepID=UPI00375708B5
MMTEPYGDDAPAPVVVTEGTPAPDTAQTRLLQLLARTGRCDPRTLDRARRAAVDMGGRVDIALLRLGLISERGLAEAYAELLGMPIVTPDQFPAEPILSDRLRPRFLRDVHALPIVRTEHALVVALTDPLDHFATAAITAATGLAVTPAIAIPVEIEAAFERLYPPSDASEGEEKADTPFEEDTERLRDMASEAPVIRLVNQIIFRAVENRASDIHIEPFEDRLRIRYRYDGILHEVESPPASLTAAVISRIKIMARLDIAERRLPQDGRIRLPIRGHEVDFRVSTIPSLHGETVVLRVLDRSAVTFDYATLGIAPAVVACLSRTLALPNGMVLVTGPTGSGKTTTLYSGLLTLNTVDRNVVTVEDPIEFQLPGISQIQVKPQIGLNFATLLRAILRQDPDVVMVGEIRDVETAQIAVQAALTGHLVLSTLHTNSAAAAIVRLRDMGVEDYLLTAVLRGVMAQRLVRRLCGACRQPRPASPELVTRFGLAERSGGQAVILFQPMGCPRCRHTGYAGRLAITEFLVPDEVVTHLVFTGGDHAAIERAAIAGGMVPMFETGLNAALTGQTTIEEVTRSIRAEQP